MSLASLKRYTLFLYQNHLDDLVELYIKKNIESNLRYSKSTSKFNKPDVIASIKEEMELFLTQIKEDKVSDATTKWTEELISGKFPLLSGNKIVASNAVMLFNNRKYALINFLPLYTKDVNELTEILKVLEDLFIVQEIFIIQCFEKLNVQTNEDSLKPNSLEHELTECKTSLEKSESLSHVGHCEFDYSKGTVNCSEGFYRIVGIDLNTNLTINLLKSMAIKENGFSLFSEKPSQIFKEGQPNFHEFKIRRLDRETRVLCSNDYPIADKSGKVIGYRSFIQDITKLKEIEEQLKEGQSQIQKILDFSPTIIAIYDIEKDKLIYINWQGKTLFGYSIKELLEMKFLPFLQSRVPLEDRAKANERIQSYTTLKDDEYSHIEYRIIDSSKNVRWVYTKAIVFKRENGKVKHILFNAADVTELKEAEKELRHREEQLNEAQRIAHVGSYDWDILNDCAVISKEQRRIYGFPLDKKEMNISEFRSILKPGELHKLQNVLSTFRSEPVENLETEYVIVMPDKSEKNILSRAKAVRNSEGDLIRIVGTVMDITSLKKTEEELKFKEAQLLETQKIASVGSFEWNMVNDRVTGTEELFRILDFPPNKKEFTVSDFKKLFLDADEVRKFEDNVREAIQNSITFEAEYKIKLPDKTEKYIITRSKTIYNDAGDSIKIIGSVMDTTSLKKVEIAIQKKNDELHEAYNKLEKAQEELKGINAQLEERVRIRTKELKESKELYHTFIKQSSVGVWRSELKDIPYIDTTLPADQQVELILKHVYIAEANDHFAKMFGFQSTDALIGHKLSDFLLISEEQKHQFYKKGIHSGYKLDDYEIVVKTKQGAIITTQGSVIGIVQDNKLVRGWGIIRDVTDRRLAVEALKASEEQYRFLAETVPTIFWSSLPDGEMDYSNQRWYEYTGSTYKESKKNGWAPFLHPDDLSKTKKVWEESLETGKSYQMEYRLKRADGVYHWHLGRALPLKDKEGNIIKWMGTSTDIEEQKSFSEKLKQKNEELDNFIYSASHDLKNPITNIEGLLKALDSELSEEHAISDDVGGILTMMATSIDKFKNNLFDLIEITKAQQRSEETAVENDLSDIIKEVKFTIEGLIKDSDAEISTDFKECSVIKFSPNNLQSILYNLMSNAIKYRSPDRKPEIIVSTKLLKDYILLSVKDNGRGLDSSQVEKVFSQFKRFHSDVEGSGVGLYIIKRIITNAGGKVDLESEEGKGSVFKVYFKRGN